MPDTITRVVHINEPHDVYIGRRGRGEDGYFGNPFRLTLKQSRGSTLDDYQKYFDNRIKEDIEFRTRIEALRGKTLGCFCKPQACHGDIIAAYLNARPDQEESGS